MRVDLDEAKRLSDALAFAEDKQIVDAMLAELRLLHGIFDDNFWKNVEAAKSVGMSHVTISVPVKALEEMG